MDVNPMMSHPSSAGPPQGSFHPEHHHSHSAHSIHSGHSHSFSTASLPSLASSSTSFSIASQADGGPGSGMYIPGFTPTTEYAPAPMFGVDPKTLALNTNVPPHTVAVPQGVGLGIGVGLPPTPLSGTLPPALLGRSPIAPGSAIMPVSTP